MDMKLSAEQIKQLRKAKLWSQEELATVSNLSLRTIQRIETSGNASLETSKSLAAALEVNVEDLLHSNALNPYRHTQIGWTILLVLLVVYAVLQNFLPTPEYMGGILLLIALLFGCLSVRVSDAEIRWFFGPGLIHKRELIEDIESCTRVTNKWWWGWGIRFHPFGNWLYNVSGFDAVEISMKSGRKFRIGTDEPAYLEQAINEALKKSGRSA